MDRFFLRHVLPVFLDGPWPKLQYLRIRGVGQRGTIPQDAEPCLGETKPRELFEASPIVELLRRKLSESLGPVVVLGIEEDPP